MTDRRHKRHRGAQPGNHNAFKHGFYSTTFAPEVQSAYSAALRATTLEEEIALLRTRIIPLVSSERSMRGILPQYTRLLDRLVRSNDLLKKLKDMRAAAGAGAAVTPAVAAAVATDAAASATPTPPALPPRNQSPFSLDWFRAFFTREGKKSAPR